MKFVNGNLVADSPEEQAQLDTQNTSLAPIEAREPVKSYSDQVLEQAEKQPSIEQQIIDNAAKKKGAGEQFLEQFGKTATGLFGYDADAQIKKDLSPEAYKYFLEQAEANAREHSTATLGGKVAGVAAAVAPMFLPGVGEGVGLARGLGEAAVLGDSLAAGGASLGRQLLARSLGGALEGAALNAPQAIGQAVLSDPKEAAESLAVSAGLGALLGPLAKLGELGFSSGANKLAEYGSNKLGSFIAKSGEEGSEQLNLFKDAAKEKLGDKGKEFFKEAIKSGSELFGLGAGLTHGPVGGIVGKGVGKLGGIVADNVIERIPESVFSTGFSKALEAAEYTKSKLDEIPSILSNASSGSFSKPSITNALSMLGKDYANLSAEDAVLKLSKNLAVAQSTGKDVEHVGNLTSELHGEGDIQAAYSGQQLNALNYIQQAIPKNPNPPTPFTKDNWKPTKEQSLDFINTLHNINDPTAILKKFESGTLTDRDVNDVKNVYPVLYQKMQNRFQEEAFNPKYENMPYAAKAKMSLLLQAPIDTSFQPANIIALQQSYSPQAQKQAGANPKGSKKAIGNIPNPQTEINKISAGITNASS